MSRQGVATGTTIVALVTALVGVLLALSVAGAGAAGVAFGLAVSGALIGAALLLFGFIAPSRSEREFRRVSAERAPQAAELWDSISDHDRMSTEELGFVALWHPDPAIRSDAAMRYETRRVAQRQEDRRRAEETWRAWEDAARFAGAAWAGAAAAAGASRVGGAAGAGAAPRRPSSRRLPDYYAILAVSPRASDDEIARAFRKQMTKHHPDHGGDEEHAKLINEAYAALKDPAKRREYDLMRRYGA